MSKVSTIIASAPPNDGREWHCQCARCGSSLDFEMCEACGGEGVDGHDCGEDCCVCLHPEDNVTCDACGGRQSFPECASTPDWCNKHPLPDRENVPRNTVEWYCVEETP